jgi:type IV secretion system protein VirB8
MDLSMFKKGSTWDADRVKSGNKQKNVAFAIAGAEAVIIVVLVAAIVYMLPLRRTVPYLVKVDGTGNVEVLQTFDNRQIGKQDLTDQYWARTYVKAREQYSWWMIGSDYEMVQRLSEPSAFADYAAQFQGEKAMDKVFGETTDRSIKILSVTPNPSQPYQMIVRFERTTKSKGAEVEPPTVFVAQLVYRYKVKTVGSQADLQQNPLGYEVVSYRRDAEVNTLTAPADKKPTPSNTTGNNGAK